MGCWVPDKYRGYRHHSIPATTRQRQIIELWWRESERSKTRRRYLELFCPPQVCLPNLEYDSEQSFGCDRRQWRKCESHATICHVCTLILFLAASHLFGPYFNR